MKILSTKDHLGNIQGDTNEVLKTIEEFNNIMYSLIEKAEDIHEYHIIVNVGSKHILQFNDKEILARPSDGAI